MTAVYTRPPGYTPAAVASYLLKAPDASMAAWKKAADVAGVSFAAWLRQAADAAAAGVPLVTVATSTSTGTDGPPSADRPPAKRAGRARVGPCIHRRGPDEFCPRCDA